MRLCLSWGVRSPSELWAALTPSEWSDWVEFAEVEPFGPAAFGASIAWLGNLLSALKGIELPIDDALITLGHRPIPKSPPRPLTLEQERAQIEAAISGR